MFVNDAWKIIARTYCPREDKNCKTCPQKTRCIKNAKSTALFLQKTYTFVPKDEKDVQAIYREQVIDDAKILDETTNPDQTNPQTRHPRNPTPPAKPE